MGEFFDITFFVKANVKNEKKIEKQFQDILSIRDWRNQLSQHHFPLLVGKEVVFGVYHDTDFISYCLSISEITFTKKNIDNKTSQILEIVDACFNNIPEIFLATGVYELTYDFIESVKQISDFNGNVLSKFPFLFFRNENEYGYTSSKKYGNLFFVLQTESDAQIIYTNPVGELMEDEGLSFDEV